MTNIQLHEQVEIERPSDEVWHLVADYTRDPEWRAGVATMTPNPLGTVMTGTTTAEELRFAGRTWRNAGEVTGVEEGAGFTWRTTSGTPAYGARRITALTPTRTRIDLLLTVTPPRSQRLLRPILARLLARTLRGDAQRLRMIAERSQREGPKRQEAGAPSSLTSVPPATRAASRRGWISAGSTHTSGCQR